MCQKKNISKYEKCKILKEHNAIKLELFYDLLYGDMGTYDRIYPEISIYDQQSNINSVFKYGNFKDFLSRNIFNKKITFNLKLDWFSNKIEPGDKEIIFKSRGDDNNDANINIKYKFITLENVKDNISIKFINNNFIKNVFQNIYFKLSAESNNKFIKYEIYLNNSLLINKKFSPEREKIDINEALCHGQFYIVLYTTKNTYREYFIINEPNLKYKCIEKFGISDYNSTYYNNLLNINYHRRFIDLSFYNQDYEFNGKYLPTDIHKDINNIIFCFKKMPNWLSKKKDSTVYYKYGPSDYKKYYQLMLNIFKEIKSNNLLNKKIYIEVWNESSIKYEYEDDFDTLMEITKILFNLCNDFKFYLVGLNTHTIVTPYSNYIENYIKNLVSNNINLKYISFHTYTYDTLNFEKNFNKMIEYCKTYEFKLLITEFGFRYPYFSYYEQCYYTFKMFLLIFKNYEYIENFLLFRTKGTISDEEYSQDCSNGYNLISYKGNAQPLFYLITKINNYFHDMEYLKDYKTDSYNLYEFSKNKLKTVYIIDFDKNKINFDTDNFIKNFLNIEKFSLYNIYIDIISCINDNDIVIVEKLL